MNFTIPATSKRIITIVVATLAVCSVITITTLSVCVILGVKPDPTLLTAYVGITTGSLGALTGLLLDAALGWPLGYNGFGKTLAAFIIGQCWKRFNTMEQPWVRFSIIAASSCLSSLSIFVLFWLLQRSLNRIFLGASLLQAFITAAVAIIVFAGFESMKRSQTRKAH